MEIMPRPRWRAPSPRGVSRHGTVRRVVRVGHGPRTPIRAAYGSPEFEAQYHAAIRGEAAPGPRKPGAGTLQWLWDLRRYRDSSAWAQLSMATRRQRENIMAGVLRKASAMPISGTDQKGHCRRAREDRKATPAQANNFIKLMRSTGFASGRRMLSLSSHPTPRATWGCSRSRRLDLPFWTEADIERFTKLGGLSERASVSPSTCFLYTRIAPRLMYRQAWTSACPRWNRSGSRRRRPGPRS